MTDKPFGEAIVELMEERQMSARELSRRTKRLNPGGGTISHLTLGFMHPAYETIELIAHALEVSPDTFPEYRLETIRRSIDWRAPRDQMPKGRRRFLARALKNARMLGLDV